MAAYTSTQAGNWSNSATWGGGGVPGDGDTATVAHAVAVDTNTTVGTSPNDTTTFVVVVNSSGALTINTGVTLTCKGNLQVAPSSVTAGVTINGSGKLLFDGSAVSSTRFYLLSCSTNGRLNLAGTDANNRATVDAASGGGCWQLGRVSVSLASSNWGLLNRCGDASNSGFTGANTAGSGQTIDVQNTLFTNCGYIRFAANHATATVLLQDVEFQDSVGTANQLIGFANADMTCNRCVFDKGKNLTVFVAEAWLATNNYFGGKLQNVSPSKGWKTGSGNNFLGHPSGNGLAWRGSMEDAYYFHYSADNENYIVQSFVATDAGNVVKGIILDYGDTSASQPDGLVVSSLTTGLTYDFSEIIKLPDSAGESSGAVCNCLSTAAVAGTYTFNHNTYVTQGGVTQNGFYIGETGGSNVPGLISSFKSNLAWTPSGKTQGWKYKRHGSGTTQDHVAAADADYNWGWNLTAGTDGNGYEGDGVTPLFSTGTPDTNGGNGDPQFVDTSRNLVRFDIDYLGNSAATAWADATSYAVGDVVSASDAGYYDGETINWRCITAHTSADANATNGKPGAVSGFRTNWEPMSLYRLREDPTRIASLITWVRAGYAVQNASLQNAGHDSVTIGAGEFVSSGPAIPVLAHYYLMQG